MEDVLTDIPPPSRFFEEDISNFFPKSPLLPPPLIRLNPNPNPPNLRPSLLIIFISPPSLSLLHSIPNKTLIGTLILPTKSCNIFSLDSQNPTAIFVAVQHKVSDEMSRAVARAVLDEIRAERVLIMDSIKAENYRSGLRDGSLCFKLETSAERMGEDRLVRDWEYLPSGSVMGGIGAAVIGECQIRGWKAAMCATWPEKGGVVVAEKLRDVMTGLGFGLDGNEVGGDDDGIRVSCGFHSDMYV